jgi:hypothetical protein
VLVQAYSGFVWAGFELAAFNFVFDATTPQKRVTCVSYYNVLNGAAIFAGAMLGTLIVKYNSIFWSKYLLIFIVSFVLRYAVSFALIPKIKEVRQVEDITYKEMMGQFLVLRPHNFMIMHIPARIPVFDKIKNMNHELKDHLIYKFKRDLKQHPEGIRQNRKAKRQDKKTERQNKEKRQSKRIRDSAKQKLRKV